MSFLEVSRLSKRYGRTNAVVDLSLDLDEQVILGLVGPNGAGKSTLLAMLATVLQPSKGHILVGGVDAAARPREVRSRIGYVPEVYGLYDDVRVWEYLDFFARCYNMERRLRQGSIAEILKLVDLFDFRFAYCRSLSRGMQQKLVIARALLHDPDLLLLDEPLAGLDPQSRLEMLEVLRELGSLGKTIIISSHLIGEMVDVCDQIGIMAAGQLTTIGTVPELVRQLDPLQRVRLVVLDDEERAMKVLESLPMVDEVERSGSSFTFLCRGTAESMAAALREIVAAGIKVVQFSTVAQPLHELVASATRTQVSPDQMEA